VLEHYRGLEGREFLKRQTLVLAASAVALCAVFGDGRLDLAVEHWFYDETLHAFPLANHWLLKNTLHDAARIVSATAALILFAVAAAAWAMPRDARLRVYRKELLFAAIAALAATLTVGTLKHFSAHACPWDLEHFGGTALYHPLLAARPAPPVPVGCFPAAHPLSGYAWLAAGFSLLPHAPRLARRWWQLAFLLGTLLGAVQVARGAHFPSHVLWTAWVTWAVNVALLSAQTRARFPLVMGGRRLICWRR
jgi:membrane-associated PAP2 superfamily phosphatase